MVGCGDWDYEGTIPYSDEFLYCMSNEELEEYLSACESRGDSCRLSQWGDSPDIGYSASCGTPESLCD